MIQRFEDEYPETRLPGPTTFEAAGSHSNRGSRASSPVSSLVSADQGLSDAVTDITIPRDEEDPDADADADANDVRRAKWTRHASDVSLASRALALEEGRVHRIGQQVKRDILAPEAEDPAPGTPDEALRNKLDALSGEEIRDRVVSGQWEATIREMGANVSDMKWNERDDMGSSAAEKQAEKQAEV